MTFTKASPRFGQWSDGRANTVYGLGFTAENDLVQVTGDSLMVSPITSHKASNKASLLNDIVWYPTTLVHLTR